jgi:hypothetical protein
VPAPTSFEYAIVRVVPQVEREEFVNAGVIVYCEALGFLEATIELDEQRLLALAPGLDLELVRLHLEAIPRICQGGEAGGPIGELTPRERWRWLVSPRSTVIQTSPPHAGLGEAPREALERLVETTVRLPPGPAAPKAG